MFGPVWEATWPHGYRGVAIRTQGSGFKLESHDLCCVRDKHYIKMELLNSKSLHTTETVVMRRLLNLHRFHKDLTLLLF